MTWWAIDVRAAPEERERLGAWLVARTGQAVEERDDGTLVTFAPDDATADRLIAELGRETKAPTETSRRRIEPVDWSTRWRDGLGPRRFGRLTVTPSWVPPVAPVGPVVMLEPAGMYGRWVKVRTWLQIFPFYRRGMFKRQKSFQKSERLK